MTGLNYKRSVGVRFGPGSLVQAFELAQGNTPNPFEGLAQSFSNIDDNGIRIRFDFFRSNRGEPDKGVVELYNLTEDASKSIVDDFEVLKSSRIGALKANAASPPAVKAAALRAVNVNHQVQVFAGYQQRPELVFVGEYTDVRSRQRDSFTDFYTRIELGDTISSLRKSFLNQGLGGVGVTPLQIVQELANTAGLRTSEDTTAFVNALTPTANVTLFNNGVVAMSSVPDALDAFADQLGLQWYVREGVLHMLPQGTAIPDFALSLVAGRDLLDFNDVREDKGFSGKAYMNARIEPGRGMRIYDDRGVPVNANGFVVQTARYVGDTHGSTFFVEFQAGQAIAPLPLPGADLIDPSIGI